MRLPCLKIKPTPFLHLARFPLRSHSSITRPAPNTGILIHFKTSSGQFIKSVEGNAGDSLLDLSHEHDIGLEGACEASLACSTCHVILEQATFDGLDEASDEENDMLDLAFGLTETSRLGCQVRLSPEMHGAVIKLPSATRNMFVDKRADKISETAMKQAETVSQSPMTTQTAATSPYSQSIQTKSMHDHLQV